MSIFGINGANNFSNANEANLGKQVVNTEKSRSVSVRFNRDKAVRIGLNSLKVIFALAGVSLPVAGVVYDIKKISKKSEQATLEQAIKNYEIACPNIKKLYDEIKIAKKLMESIVDYNDSDPRFEGVRSKLNTALTNWKNQTGVPDVEKLATIHYGGKNLDLIQAHKLLEDLKKESSDFSGKAKNIGIANSIYRIVESVIS